MKQVLPMTPTSLPLYVDDERNTIAIEGNEPYKFESNAAVDFLIDVVQEIENLIDSGDDTRVAENFLIVYDPNEVYYRAYDFGRHDVYVAYEFIQEYFATKAEIEDNAE